MSRALYLQSQTALALAWALLQAPLSLESCRTQWGGAGWWELEFCQGTVTGAGWSHGGFALHSQARNSSRKANGSRCASVSLPIRLTPPRRYHMLRRGVRGSKTSFSGLATQKESCQPRGPWGTWDNPDFHTSSVSQQALVRFAGGARSISKHCFPTPAWPWGLLHLPLVAFPALLVPRE